MTDAIQIAAPSNAPRPSVDAQVVMLISTFARLQKFVPLISETLDRMWPGHPSVLMATDGPADPVHNLRSYRDPTWAGLMLEALKDLRREHPKATHVFHMLEDHCPLRAVDQGRVDTWIRDALDRDFAALSFLTYPWPWDRTSDVVEPDGSIRVWRKVNTIPMAEGRAAVVPREFLYYFQLQPTLWRLDYLLELCEHAVESGKSDAWRFEMIRWEKTEQHYIADYAWPTVHNGFWTEGRANPWAVAYADRRLAGGLRAELMKAAIGRQSELRFAVHLAYQRVPTPIRRRLSALFA